MAKILRVEISLASQDLSGGDALEIRNAIEEQIDDSGVGEVVGGGCATDGSSCDFEVSTDDADAAEAFLRGLMEHAGLADATTIQRE